MKHRWSMDFPGNTCLDCGLPDPLEETWNSLIDCSDCQGKGGLCFTCYGTGSVVNPEIVIPPCPGDRYGGL